MINNSKIRLLSHWFGSLFNYSLKSPSIEYTFLSNGCRSFYLEFDCGFSLGSGRVLEIFLNNSSIGIVKNVNSKHHKWYICNKDDATEISVKFIINSRIEPKIRNISIKEIEPDDDYIRSIHLPDIYAKDKKYQDTSSIPKICFEI